MVVVVEDNPDSKGLVFVMHGLGGFKEQPHIQTFSDAFREKQFTVVTFDTTNSIGESEGKYEDATTTNYYEDLEDVIDWASKQGWYKEPFYLAGHSLGGFSVALFAENFPSKVRAVAPISTMVSGKLSFKSKEYRDYLEEWKKTGWKIAESKSKAGVIKRLPWSHMENRLKYDLLSKANMLTMPVLMIVGVNDESTPPEHQKILFDAVPGSKEFHVIKNAPHTFKDADHLKEIKTIFSHWIDKVET